MVSERKMYKKTHKNALYTTTYFLHKKRGTFLPKLLFGVKTGKIGSVGHWTMDIKLKGK